MSLLGVNTFKVTITNTLAVTSNSITSLSLASTTSLVPITSEGKEFLRDRHLRNPRRNFSASYFIVDYIEVSLVGFCNFEIAFFELDYF